MKLYRKRGLTRMEPWNDQTDMQGVSIGKEDRDKGSPKHGDMIAQDTNNPNDRWLISKLYFETNYEEAK
jgi:hypothetical protein